MGLEDLLLHAQEPANCSYHGPDKPNLSLPIPLLKIHFNIILPFFNTGSRWGWMINATHRPLYSW
jgi:hypothetical protein